MWTGDTTNGENGHLDASSDRFVSNYKGGSFHSLNTTKSGFSGHGRENTHSRNGSSLSMASGSQRDKSRGDGIGHRFSNDSKRNGATDSTDISFHDTNPDISINGTQSRTRSPSPGPVLLNGYHTSSDEHTSADHTPLTSIVPSLSTVNTAGLAPYQHPQQQQQQNIQNQQSSQPLHRHSSPSPVHMDSEAHRRSSISPQRHTLQVPRVSNSGRKNGRNLSTPNANPSEDNLAGSDRYASPQSSALRRSSLNLARRNTRSIHSDTHVDDILPDDEAARYTETIKQRRASKRRRKEDEDDDRVIVGTKVDQNHVNWVTAYNMLTGIRFTVSRTNAKLDRELTPADFEAKHKFSFDM